MWWKTALVLKYCYLVGNFLSPAGQVEYTCDNNQDILSSITPDSLQDDIYSLKPLKAPGLDGIVNVVIKKCPCLGSHFA